MSGKRLQTPELADTILASLAAGRSLRSICEPADMPTEAAVRAWAVADHAGFGERMERARVLGCHALADEIIEIADAAHDSDSAAAARVQTENRRWLLSKLLPRTYGDRLDVNHSVTVAIGAELSEARRRAALLARDATLIVDVEPMNEPARMSGSTETKPGDRA